MKKLVLFLAAGLLFTGLTFAQDALTDDGQLKGNSKKATSSRGDDANIKIDKRANTANMETQAVQPEEKGATESRGSGSGTCNVDFENYTEWYIDCYVDGYYEGYVSPWGSGEITVGSGETCLYAVAVFDDGSKVSWGPACATCYDQFIINIYNDFYEGSYK